MISQILFEKKCFPSLLRLFDHTDIFVNRLAIASIKNIFYGESIESDLSLVHPYFDSLDQEDGIKKIFSLFKRTQDEETKLRSATTLGIAFRAREMTDPEMKIEIISHLKANIDHEDEETRNDVKLAINCLSQNSGGIVTFKSLLLHLHGGFWERCVT
ncbi:MAG: hypothetical protein EZS28_035788 [Streblomastix strix]|uniref:Condensin complex subunit 1 C-terminal domain-containing protein n=1 Tax=Streblomastix strix TaxID=222440 RepID=A0A5J4UD25_9EUKA|nr:MAG: hypothetical protein EZS28_035788 [Streblomastix strix]